ncbi:dirigent protein 1-like [Andrographis paniculata]|uniref:dirigent protein 1-like n=1 Tax=Andrographis paniculata TaxID=175694 RepID=UPI0021E7AF78|nr:dirigent protein 1-like [Andrographis paniculata]
MAMETFNLILVLISLLNILQNSQSQTTNQLTLRSASIIRFTYYTHPVWKNSNQSIFSLARTSISDQVPSRFGILYACDILVKDGPEIESKELGRLQGAATTEDLKETATGEIFNLIFTHGEYKGSTVSFMGRNPILNRVRGTSIVGGSGAFRRAWGYVIITTYSVDQYGYNDVVKCDAVVYNTTYT